jgi:mono/diheme cytochrome c family protein
MKSSMKAATIALVLATVLALPFLTLALAEQKDAQYIASGEKLFKQYCASCHGIDGKGTGPAAAALKVAPADLTALQKKGEKFPSAHVQTVIDGQRDIAAHGSREMPVWGTIFRTKRGDLGQADIVSLTKYLESIQKPS